MCCNCRRTIMVRKHTTNCRKLFNTFVNKTKLMRTNKTLSMFKPDTPTGRNTSTPQSGDENDTSSSSDEEGFEFNLPSELLRRRNAAVVSFYRIA
ncbi:hypothetical protein F8203_gp144 [Heliothis virescens ascovirus 3f]|uniref:Uncharacterized protein n=1 Tax=Heliothis virescens ascovirus 3f TaxID=328614 RepID=A0A171PVP9_9VIRU|nr:hypothetical protein F8203_gp144 [Heliothis virescens ascovirus 3f]AJP09110.1 hypothetical protein [Heliothis virescens ascovirus 3f]